MPPPTRLRSLDFSTAEVRAGDRFEAWRDVHAAVVDLSPNHVTRAFSARHRTWDLGGMALQTLETDGVRFGSLAEQAKRDPLDHWVVSLFVSGRCTIESAGGVLESAPDIPQITSLRVPFHGQVTRAKAHVLYIPRDTCREDAHLLDAASLTTLHSGMGAIFADYLTSLEARMEQIEPADLAELVAATRSLLIAAIAPSVERLREAGDMINRALLERARQCVQDNLHNPALDVNFILHRLGVSRSRLYRLFEASGGIMHYIQKRRLIAAHKALADPHSTRRIFEVAEEFCFNDAAEFSRAFRRQFSCCPSEVRTTGGGAPKHPPLRQSIDLSDLLKRM